MNSSVQQTQKLKSVELEILKYFIDICEKENIQYFLIGGTALGAVRHKGFIPWDDDIDVGMPRADYEKFISVAQKYLPEYYFLQNFYTDQNYPNNFSKIRDSRTAFIETSCRNIDMNHGVYIDIFPLDGYPATKLPSKIFDFKKKLINSRISMVFETYQAKSLKSKIALFLLKIVYPNYRTAVRSRETLYKKYNYSDSRYVVNHGGAWGRKEIVLKSYFGNGALGEFENLKVIIPENYDQYLKNVYGDYMTLPPKENRKGHHYCTVIDLEKSYIEYLSGDIKQ
ncbi:MAG: LicD family protein [Ruminococcaceae bacterium]|nr:LicD family protein [Oscillospiraceae bacterium]